MKRIPVIALLVPVVFIVLGSQAARAETYTYAVKFICGASDSKSIVMPGYYATAINVHNPEGTGAKLAKWFSEALPEEKPGRVSKSLSDGLGPREAFEVDCPEIMKMLGNDKFIKGFATIVSNARLNVTAVYTAAGKDGYVRAMDVETIEPKVGQTSLKP